MEKSKDRRGSSRSLFGSLLQRATSFRGISKTSPKRSSASEFVDIDPKFTNVEFKFNQDVSARRMTEKVLKDKTFQWSYHFQIEKNTVIIPLHSPNDSPEELVTSDSESNITRADVHVSYEPTQQIEMETESTKITSGNTVKRQKDVVKESSDKIEVFNNIAKVDNIAKKNVVNSSENSSKMTNNLAKPGEPLLSPGLSR